MMVIRILNAKPGADQDAIVVLCSLLIPGI
jgi:hypothetical protein